jgi:uncharacterized protein YbjT (DUF2867 family)
MRLLILGASGGVGRWLTRLAAERHQVTALVRPEADVALPTSVALRRGDVTDPGTLDALVAGQDAVLSCLGLRRAGKSPWAPLRSPPDLTARVTAQLVRSMAAHEVRRVVAVSAGGVGDSVDRLSWPVRRLVAAGNVAVAYRDLAAMEAALAASALDWLAVRPVTLVDGAPSGGAREVERYALTSTVRRSNVAEWMLGAVERGALGGRAVLLGS